MGKNSTPNELGKSTSGKIIPNFLARNRLWFSKSHRDICTARTVLNIQTLRTAYNHVEISCHCLSPVFLKNVIYAVCRCTVNCFQGISLLQVEANDSKLFCSQLTWHCNSQFFELFASTQVTCLCVPKHRRSSVHISPQCFLNQNTWKYDCKCTKLVYSQFYFQARLDPKGAEKPFIPH